MHTIDIPQRYVDWVVGRRGRRHIFERIDPTRTALLVIDMQNGFLIPGYSPLEVPGLAGIVPNVNRLVRCCRDNGVLVVWTQQTYAEEWRSWARNFATPEMRDRIIAETAPGAHGFEIHDSLDIDDADMRVVKRRSSAFTPGASDLHERLQASGHDTLIVTGTLTNVCCEATARRRDADELQHPVRLRRERRTQRRGAQRDAGQHDAVLRGRADHRRDGAADRQEREPDLSRASPADSYEVAFKRARPPSIDDSESNATGAGRR